MFGYDVSCYLCREIYDYYTKLVLPDAQFIMKFFPDFKEDSDNLCETCFKKFREIFEFQNPKPVSPASSSNNTPAHNPILSPEEKESRALARQRILDEIKKAI